MLRLRQVGRFGVDGLVGFLGLGADVSLHEELCL